MPSNSPGLWTLSRSVRKCLLGIFVVNKPGRNDYSKPRWRRRLIDGENEGLKRRGGEQQESVGDDEEAERSFGPGNHQPDCPAYRI